MTLLSQLTVVSPVKWLIGFMISYPIFTNQIRKINHDPNRHNRHRHSDPGSGDSDDEVSMTHRLENNIARCVVLIVTFVILVGLGYLFANAFLEETEARVENLRIHRQAQVERITITVLR